ncbi:hypothetical protein [Nostocoides vanveenii]|jgi:hypothetical protein|uniref:Uncharacterized protein n=1 Tax=Nostocoides vanveenii TaxID=330835 RepID=A0ABN2K7Z2_9MICO
MKSTRTRAIVVTATMALTLSAAAAPTFAASSPAASSRAASSAAQKYTYDFRTGATTDPQAAPIVKKLLAALPKDWQARRAAFLAKTGAEPGPVGRSIEAQLTGAKCEPTTLNAYVEKITAGIPLPRLFVLALVGAFDYPTYDALIYGSRTDADYSLTPGTTGKVRYTTSVARGFWDIKSGDIAVMGMHSNMVVDRARVIRTVQTIFGVSAADAAQFADLIIPLILDTKQLRDGNNPMFSLNAFAFTAEGQAGLEGIGDRIVMGEGMIKALRDTGNIEVGPQMVLSHEYGHHVQFENHAYPAQTSPENTRMMELMADAYGAYLDSHREGLNFNAERVNGAIALAHLVGDCAVNNPGHHGTPSQRAAAASWGASLAKSNGTTVLPSKQVQALFLKALPAILKH